MALAREVDTPITGMTNQVIPQVRGTMLDPFGWLFLTLMVLFVLFALFVIVGP